MFEAHELDAASIAASVLMLRQDRDATILIIEGARDYRFFSKFIEAGACEMVLGYGKEAVIEVVRLLEARGVRGILGVVDADCDIVLGIDRSADNLISNADRDIELMMFRSEAFERLLNEKASPEKVAIVKRGCDDIREWLCRLAVPIGLLRIYSIKEGASLRFRGLSFAFINRDLELRIDELVRLVFNHSRCAKSHGHALAYIDQGKPPEWQMWHVVSGHDVCEILARALQKVLGSVAAKAATGAEIESLLRLAYHRADFEQTDLFARMRDWEHKHPTFKLLRAA